ncbi:MAG: thiamine pyrophosphate-binding protein [Chloroflexi bacterium]|nr:thiamine pyrophosphate-binding protein [Chloroflexota bacterium]MDA1226754.1 thiamine pyrophosphate-binding protein [Chloroflexota bacterium]
MPRMTGKKALMEMLRAEGVEYIFGNPGTSEGPILDELENYPDLKYMLATQEGAAMGMADAYARSRNAPAFVNLHIETGLANGISLLANAAEGNTPLVLTSANKDIRKLVEGRPDLTEMVSQFCKWSAEVTHPEQVPGVMRRAFNEAKTPPMGPTYVAFSANALDDEGEMDIVPSSKSYSRTGPDSRAVEDASAIFADALNPVMIVGDRVGQSGGSAEAVRVAELLGARVYATNFSQVNFPTSHPQFMGMLNPTMPAGRKVLESADAVLAVGTDVFSGLFHFSGRALDPDARLVHIDCDASEIGKSEPTDIGILADPKVALAELAAALESSMSGSAQEAAKGRAATVAQEKAAQKQAWQSRVQDRWNMETMSAERMMAELAAALPSDAIIVDDAVTTRAAIFGAMDFDEPGSILGITGGALGWGMGGTLGAKLANPNRSVVGIVGDGSAMMTVQALWTAANADIPVVYVVCNNQAYRVLKLNMNIYKEQVLQEENPQSQYIAMDFPTPFNLAGMAEAMGVYGKKITDPIEIGPALKAALASGKPALLDISIDGSL